MQWYQHAEPTNVNYYRNAKVMLNDDNIHPEWVEYPVKYSEVHTINGSNTILVNIGESWAYGENVKGIASALQNYNLDSQLEYTFGPIMASKLNVDLYQYARPGNSNGYMFSELERIIAYINRTFNYDKILLVMQMTEPSREHAHLNTLDYNHPIQKLYQRDQNISFYEWLKKYDEIFLDILDKIERENFNLDAIVWKNFCKWNTDLKLERVKQIQPNWIAKSAELLNINYRSLSFQSIGWLDEIYNNKDFFKINFDKHWLNKEMAKIEKSNNFLKANKFHSMHPNHKGHAVWADHLLTESGWLDE